ncbi:hypothetical protein DRJ17_07690 [Candidatus Woesearchaeota archaeon]|nr:MAG: hypothetical protein DRJ17_07690 [Candidatus Woesearchaeota archaeon]
MGAEYNRRVKTVPYKITIKVPDKVYAKTPFQVTGEVTLDGSPVAGAKVTLYVNGEPKGEVYTSSDGRYVITTMLDEGEHVLKTLAEISVVEPKTLALVIGTVASGAAIVYAAKKLKEKK